MTEQKNNKETYKVVGIVCTILGLFFTPLLIVGIVLLVKYNKMNKADEELVAGEAAAVEPELAVKLGAAEAEIPPVIEQEQAEPISEERYNELKKMCADIHKEYTELLKSYKDADTEERVYILRECYRKLDVIRTTVEKYKCYYEVDTYEEMEKIEKKARSFINAYIKEQREAGYDDYMIDVDQFSFDLDFISDYIDEKSEKLNK